MAAKKRAKALKILTYIVTVVLGCLIVFLVMYKVGSILINYKHDRANIYEIRRIVKEKRIEDLIAKETSTRPLHVEQLFDTVDIDEINKRCEEATKVLEDTLGTEKQWEWGYLPYVNTTIDGKIAEINGAYTNIKIDNALSALDSIWSVSNIIGVSNPYAQLDLGRSNTEEKNINELIKTITNTYIFYQYHKGYMVRGGEVVVKITDYYDVKYGSLIGTVQNIHINIVLEEKLNEAVEAYEIPLNQVKINAIELDKTLDAYDFEPYDDEKFSVEHLVWVETKSEVRLCYGVETDITMQLVDTITGDVLGYIWDLYYGGFETDPINWADILHNG